MIAMPREVKDVIEKLKNDPDFKKEVENLAKNTLKNTELVMFLL